MAAWTRHEQILDALVEAARAADDVSREAYWTGIRAATKAAGEKLKALEKAERAGG